MGEKEIDISLSQYFRDMKIAASDPSREKEIIEKYKEWMEIPMMASPSKTIKYIKQNHETEK